MTARIAALPLPTGRVWVAPTLTDHGALVAMATTVMGSVVPAVAALLQISTSCIINPPSCNPH